MTAAGTNAEDVQLPKEVWQSLVQRSLTRVCDQFEVRTKQVHVVLGHAKNDGKAFLLYLTVVLSR